MRRIVLAGLSALAFLVAAPAAEAHQHHHSHKHHHHHHAHKARRAEAEAPECTEDAEGALECNPTAEAELARAEAYESANPEPVEEAQILLPMEEATWDAEAAAEP